MFKLFDQPRLKRDYIKSGFLRIFDSDRSLLHVNALVRMGVLLVLAFYFADARSTLDLQALSLVGLLLVIFLVYNVGTILFGIIHPEWFIKPWVKLLQAIFEVTLYSIFYYLTHDPRTELFFLYFLPLIFAIYYLNLYSAIGIILFGAASLYAVLYGLAALPAQETGGYFVDHSLILTFLLRASILVSMSLAFAVRRRSSLQHAKFYDTYYELGRRLTGFEDPEMLMQRVVQETCRLVQAESASLFLLEAQVLYRTAIAGIDENGLIDEHYMVGEGITGQVVQPQAGTKYGEPIYNNHVDRDARINDSYLKEYREQLKTHKVCHVLAVPLNAEDHSFGVLRVINKLDSFGQIDLWGFSENDQDALNAIASMVAIAIEKSRLLTDAIERYQQASALYTIGQHITQAKDWEELGQVIVDETRNMLKKSSKATIYMIDESTGDLKIQCISEGKHSPSGRSPLRQSEGIAGKVIRERKLINVSDTRREPEFLYRGASELRSLLVAPLLVGNRAIGVLSVDSNQVSAFDSEDEQLLGTLANQASMAIEKARLYKQEHERRSFGDTMLEVSRKINSNLDLNKMLREIVNELSKVVPYSSITIQVIEGNRLRMIACRGFKDRNKVMQVTFPLNNKKFPNDIVVRSKRPFLVGDVHQDYPHFYKEADKYYSEHIRGWMGVPLIHRKKVIGMISLDHAEPNFYTQDMASLALTFANQVTIAIVNARLFREKSQQLINLDRLYQASRTITSSMDINEVLNKIALLAREVSQADHTGVLLLNEHEEKLDSFETIQVGMPLHERARDGGVTDHVIRTRKPVIYNRVDKMDRHHSHNPVILDAGYQSYAGLPIIKGNRVLGVLYVHSKLPGRFHRQHEIPLLQALCNHAAIAIENALLYKERARQAEMLERLVKTSNDLIQHTTLNELLEYCVHRAKEIFDVEDCSLYLKNREKNRVDLVYSSTIPSEIWPKRDTLLEGPGLTAFVAGTGQTLNLSEDEYRLHPAWSGNHGTPFVDHLNYLPSGKCHSLLISPLKDNSGENIGVLKLENRLSPKKGKKFSEFEVAMHQTFASHIATAVERARLFARLDKEARREARQALGYELHEIYNFVHGALLIRLEITKEKLARKQFSEVQVEIENMSKAAQAVNSLLRWIHYDLRGNDMIEEKGLILTLEHIAGLLKMPIKTHVVGRDTLPSQVEYALYKIGIEALTNVAKHAGDQTQAKIVLKKHAGSFAFEVSDNGFGFDEDEKFQSVVSFGFAGMRRWAESIGAKLEIQSKPSKGTIVSVYGSVS